MVYFPNVAVIISNYNYGDFVVSAIKSIKAQDYPGRIRIFLVDDGSTDDSWEKIKEYTGKHKTLFGELSTPCGKQSIEIIDNGEVNEKDDFIRISNSGASNARNVAIYSAMDWADMFAILDADDEYKPNKISKLVQLLQTDTLVGVAYGDYDIIKTYADNNYTKEELKESYSRKRLMDRCIVHSGALIKKEYIKSIILPNGEIYKTELHGPASKTFIGCTEDYDLWIRLSEKCMMAHVAESLSIVRETGQNQSMKMTTDIFNRNAKIIGSTNVNI
jgi:glycosyltransferase involved in cell wall biosynthesis